LKVLSGAKYKIGDVVITRAPVRVKVVGRDKTDGWADPGWLWRVVGVRTVNRTLRYAVVAHRAPGMYHQTFRDTDINRTVAAPKGKS
jgi:hypothetical protein